MVDTAVSPCTRRVTGEVLPPAPWQEGALVPHPMLVVRFDFLRVTDVTFEDGGVWRLPDRALATIDPGDVHANIGEIFARWPERFAFIERRRGRYTRRT